ncbi:IclR family transcriptional regulator [Alsobacter sp. SYSU BS001988]
MAGSLLERAFNILTLLSSAHGGLPLQRVADDLGAPKSAVHRLLSELGRLGMTRQDPVTGHYMLTSKLLSLGFSYLSASGVADLAQPILDQLARESGELVRLAVVDGDTLTWVAKSQGARSGLRYDPEMGGHPTLFCTATGQAWLATLDDRRAVDLAIASGLERAAQFGPNAPRTVAGLQRKLNKCRADGYATVVESAAEGAAAMASAITSPRAGQAIGTISIAGPSFRLTEARMRQLAPNLLRAAQELAETSIGSEFFSPAARAAATA